MNSIMKTYFKLLTFFSFLFLLNSVSAQEIHFSEAPENFQLFARDKSDSALVRVRGQLKKGTVYEAVKLLVYKDGELFDEQDCPLNGRRFQAASRIDAGLHEFRFELQLSNAEKDSSVLVADSVVCGDAYIITGQSNSHASSIYSKYSSQWCRSFGVKTGYETYNDDDKKVRWGRATGNLMVAAGL